MPIACSATFCSYSRQKVKQGSLDIIFHRFPSDPQRRKIWEAFCEGGPNWKPPRCGYLCSLHFTEDDYQMARSPLLKTNRVHGKLFVNAVPSVKQGQPITIAKRQAINEVTRKQLYDDLYRKRTTANCDGFSEWAEEQAGLRNSLPAYVYRLHQFPNMCAFCLTAFTEKKQFFPLDHYHEELCGTLEQTFNEIAGTTTDTEERADLQNRLPNKVCAECVEALVKFHKYQRQLRCLRKFSTGMAQLRKGNKDPLQTLYATEGTFLTGLLQDLNIVDVAEKVLKAEPEPDSDVTLAMEVQETLTMESENYAQKQMTVMVDMPTANSPSVLGMGQKRARGIPRRRQPDGNFKSSWCCPFVNVCNKWFEDQATLNQHIAIQHKHFKCDACGLKMKFYDVYKKHIESHAVARALLLCHMGKETNKELKCLICWKVFQSAELLERHKKTHTVAVGNSVFVTMTDKYSKTGKSVPTRVQDKYSMPGNSVPTRIQEPSEPVYDDCDVDPLSLEDVKWQTTTPLVDHDYLING